MSRLVCDTRAQELLDPVWPVVARLLEYAEPSRPVPVRLGEIDGMVQVVSGEVVLSSLLATSPLAHPLEPPVFGLDRWRRAAAAVGVGLLEFTRGWPREDAPWWHAGAHAMAVHGLVPELGLARAEAARALSTGSLRDTRAMCLFLSARSESWLTEMEEMQDWLDGLDEHCRKLFSPGGALGEVAAQVGLPTLENDGPPLPAGALRCTPRGTIGGSVQMAGGELELDGRRRWLVAKAESDVRRRPPGFVGRWDLKSTELPGQILGARGVTFRFFESGRAELIFADGFVGPVAMIEVARNMGHSGVSSTSWSMQSPSALTFGEFSRSPITMHERDGRRAFPQVGLGVSEWVSAMSGTTWRFARQGEQLRLHGELMGMDVRLRLMPEAG